MVFSFLVLLAALTSTAVCLPQNQSQCLDRFRAFQQCVRTKSPLPSNTASKKEYDHCFTKNGCTVSQSPPSTQIHQGAEPGENKATCFNSIKEAIGNHFQQCLQEKGVSVSDDHHEEQQQGQDSSSVPDDRPPPAVSAAQCDNDQRKADRVNSCLEQVHQSRQPSQEEVKARYEAMCKVESECKSQISENCQVQLGQMAKAFCECFRLLKPKIEEAIKNDTSCTELPPSPQNEPMECSNLPSSPCEAGFEKFYENSA